MKKFTAFMLTIMCFLCTAPTVAFGSENDIDSYVYEEIERVEETVWVYRNNNGALEKRLWSITYGYWKTGWILA